MCLLEVVGRTVFSSSLAVEAAACVPWLMVPSHIFRTTGVASSDLLL